MKEEPLVSIGLPVFNGSRYLPQALDSFLKQTYTNIELIISDNASTDSTPEICRAYSQRDSRVKFYSNETNIGSEANFKKVFERSSGKYFSWAAHDDFWHPSYAQKCVEKLINNPEAVLCCSDVVFVDENNQVNSAWTMSPWKQNRETLGLPLVERIKSIVSQAGWYTIYSFIRSDILRQIEVFPKKYGSDVLLLMELALKGGFAKVSEPLFYYRLHSEQSYSQELKQYNKPYCELLRGLVDIVSKTQINYNFKKKIKEEIFETIAFHNPIFLSLVASEQGFDIQQERSKNVILDLVKFAATNSSQNFTVKPDFPDNQKLKVKKSSQAIVAYQQHLYPPRFASARRCIDIINALKKVGYEVTLFSSNLFITSPKWTDASIQQAEKALGIKISIYEGNNSDYEYLRNLRESSERPAWRFCYTPSLHKSFYELCVHVKPSVVLITYAFLGDIALDLPSEDTISVIDTLDLLSLNQKMADAVNRYLLDPSLYDDLCDEEFFTKLALKADRSEYELYDRYDITLAISPQEFGDIKRNTNRTQVEYLPFCFTSKDSINNYSGQPIFLIGPNAFNYQAYFYFVERILPLLKLQVPDFILQVAGDGSSALPEVPGIDLLGFVPDLDSLYANARFSVCPMLGATGQQLKVLEAMSYGLPVVVMRAIAERCSVEHGVNGLIADTAVEFATYCADLYKNLDLCRELGAGARKTVEEKHSEQMLVDKLTAVLSTPLRDQEVVINHQSQFFIENQPIARVIPQILVDGVFFQLYQTGIARVWRSLLEVWSEEEFSNHLVVLDRSGTAPKIPGIRYRTIAPFSYENTEGDRAMLQQVCDEEGADLFISTYYTTPLTTPSVFMAYDMIPEVVGADLNEPMWREKHHAIHHASGYIAISHNTARDLSNFFPDIDLEKITVAHCGVSSDFQVAAISEISSFRQKYGITKPYYIVSGGGRGYKNSLLFFQAFASLASRQGFEIVCTGSGGFLEDGFRQYTAGITVHMLHLSDEELRLAYAGAIALVYPSKYEGFGLPVLEAMACGCPVITCRNASLPEVGGDAVIYVDDSNSADLADALCEVQKPSIRNALIAAGIERSQQFSWVSMAQIMQGALLKITLERFNLRRLNWIVFPNWSAPEEVLGTALQNLLIQVNEHPSCLEMTILISAINVIDLEEADLLLSSVALNLAMEQGIDISEGPEIVLLSDISPLQWKTLQTDLQGRITLASEDLETIQKLEAQDLTAFTLEELLEIS